MVSEGNAPSGSIRGLGFVILEVGVDRVAEGRRGVLPPAVEQPVREVRHDLEGFAATVVEVSVYPSDRVGGDDSRRRAVCGYTVGCIVLRSQAGLEQGEYGDQRGYRYAYQRTRS